jgi:hypothetical protein
MLAYRKASLPCAAELCSASPSIVIGQLSVLTNVRLASLTLPIAATGCGRGLWRFWLRCQAKFASAIRAPSARLACRLSDVDPVWDDSYNRPRVMDGKASFFC